MDLDQPVVRLGLGIAAYVTVAVLTAFVAGRALPQPPTEEHLGGALGAAAFWPVGLPIMVLVLSLTLGQRSRTWHLPAAWRKSPAGPDGWHEHIDKDLIVRWKERAG